MSGIFNPLIFNNSIFNTDDLILLGGTPGLANENPNYHFELPFDVYKREQEKILATRQESIIALKIEAQDNLLRVNELKKQQDKQSVRQLKALEKEQVELSKAIQIAMIELQQRKIIINNNLAILILIASYPYLNISGETMH